jgi:glucose-6-phosphate isomerase
LRHYERFSLVTQQILHLGFKVDLGTQMENSRVQQIDWATGSLSGAEIEESVKKMGMLSGVFANETQWARQDPEAIVYKVQHWRPVPNGTEGGLFWGNSTIEPGKVGDEYYMTKGHRHAMANRAEYYATVSGSGMLVLTKQRQTTVQEMEAGSLHYIPGGTAHRVVNTGSVPLTFLASWPADSGYDYEVVFGVRVVELNGRAMIVPTDVA